MTATRFDRLADRFGDRSADKHLRQVDRRYWALYRQLDLSQSEVQQTVKSLVTTSQATVSRAIRKGDTRALVEPDFIELGGDVDEEDLRAQALPEEWYEAYRETLARAVVDRAALEIIASGQRRTPEWAARRYPELVGANHHAAQHYGTQVEEFATDDHLNHLESVNTDRWK